LVISTVVIQCVCVIAVTYNANMKTVSRPAITRIQMPCKVSHSSAKHAECRLILFTTHKLFKQKRQ